MEEYATFLDTVHASKDGRENCVMKVWYQCNYPCIIENNHSPMVSVCTFCHANDKASMGITYVLYVANADLLYVSSWAIINL